MKCLECQNAMVDNRCVCGAAWIAEAKLVEMAHEKKQSLTALTWEPRSEGERRPCPICRKDMLAVKLAKVALDRCVAHGVWFDAQELERVLKRAHKLPDDPDHPPKKSGGGGWEALGAFGELLGALGDLASAL